MQSVVDFNSPTWKWVEGKLRDYLQNQLELLTKSDKSYKELLIAQGQVAALKTVLNLPQENKLLAATGKHNV